MTDQAATIERLEQELGDARLASGEWQAAAAGLTRDLRMAEAVRDRLAAEVARLKREAAPAARWRDVYRDVPNHYNNPRSLAGVMTSRFGLTPQGARLPLRKPGQGANDALPR